MDGWIKVPRSIADKAWYGAPNDVCLFIHLLMSANFTTRYFKGIEIKQGQLVRSLDSLASETGLTKNQVRTSIKHLIATHEITQERTHVGNLISIENYAFFGGSIDTDHTERHTEGHTRITHGSHTDHTERRMKKNEEKGRDLHGEYGHVSLSAADFEKLTAQFGENGRDEWIRKVDEYCERTGKTYRNYFLTIQNWAKNEHVEHVGKEAEAVNSYDEWARQYE